MCDVVTEGTPAGLLGITVERFDGDGRNVARAVMTDFVLRRFGAEHD